MVDCVRVGFAKPRDSFVFVKHRPELPLKTFPATGASERRDFPKLVIIEHRHLDLATPTPEALH